MQLSGGFQTTRKCLHGQEIKIIIRQVDGVRAKYKRKLITKQDNDKGMGKEDKFCTEKMTVH